MSATPQGPDEFSPLEREALARWRTPLPPADFAARVLARVATESERTPAPRGRLAVAAFALIVIGGVLSVRSMLGGAPGMPMQELPGGFDAGARPEVRSDVWQDLRADKLDGLAGKSS